MAAKKINWIDIEPNYVTVTLCISVWVMTIARLGWKVKFMGRGLGFGL